MHSPSSDISTLWRSIPTLLILSGIASGPKLSLVRPDTPVLDMPSNSSSGGKLEGSRGDSGTSLPLNEPPEDHPVRSRTPELGLADVEQQYEDWVASRDRGSRLGLSRFDAAAAVASIAASSTEPGRTTTAAGTKAAGGHWSPAPGAAGACRPADQAMQRVQQLAEEMLTSEDEKLVLGRAIGRGAFGTVFLGRWRNLDVAVKVGV